jgi:hypothetical protein
MNGTALQLIFRSSSAARQSSVERATPRSRLITLASAPLIDDGADVPYMEENSE